MAHGWNFQEYLRILAWLDTHEQFELLSRASTDEHMENLSLHDAGPPGGPPSQAGTQPPPVPQLPPQMFTTAAQLLDLTDSE